MMERKKWQREGEREAMEEARKQEKIRSGRRIKHRGSFRHLE